MQLTFLIITLTQVNLIVYAENFAKKTRRNNLTRQNMGEKACFMENSIKCYSLTENLGWICCLD